MTEREITALKLAYGLKPSGLDWLRRGPVASGVVTYSILPSSVLPSPSPHPYERRRARRRRTRLRSGKILDRRNLFLIEANILDRSSCGLRLRLAKDVAIPEIFHLYDDEAEIILVARIVWRRQALVGARIDPSGPARASRRQLASLRGKFYAMRD
ncbi:hypothetical protein [Rhodoblastus sp.]|uniref:hypothetical protein n=1 Tax=Rhodoblastus sp. TaxID=1962975 RepID=UPI003F96A639